MTYVQVAQTSAPTDQAAPWFVRGYVAPVPAFGTVQATFVGTYVDGGVNKACRFTVQAENGALIDPAKQYRITVEEVQP